MNSIQFFIFISIIITVAVAQRQHQKDRHKHPRSVDREQSIEGDYHEIKNILENICAKCKQSHLEECNDHDLVQKCREFEQLKSFQNKIDFMVR